MTAKFSEFFNRNFLSKPLEIKLTLLLAITAFLPFYPSAVVSIAMVIFILAGKSRREMLAQARLSWIIGIFCILLLAVPLFYRNYDGFLCGLLLTVYFTIALYLQNIVTYEISGLICDIFCVMSIINAADAFIMRMLSAQPVRQAAFFYNPNFYGYIIELVVVTAFYRFMTVKKHRIFYLITVALNLGGLLLTDCRSAWLALFFGLLAMFVMMKKTTPIIILTLISCLFAYFVYTYPMLIPRAFQFQRSSAIRMEIWHNAFHDFLDHPLFGHGLLAYYFISHKFITPHAHNMLIDALECFGMIGTLLLVAYFSGLFEKLIVAFRRGDGRDKSLIAFILGIFSATFVHGFTDVPYIGVQTGLILFLLISLRAPSVRRLSSSP